MDPVERERLTHFVAGLHAVLLVILIALRPLVWDGDAASPPNLVYLALVLIALFVTTIEIICGGRKIVRWSWTGLAVAGFVVALVPAAVHAPVPPDGQAFWWQLVLHLGLGAYLMQIIPGRERLAWSALVTGVVTEVGLSWIQGLYVLPRMAEATRDHVAAVAMEGVSSGDLAERIAYGGWFGTFTLSNTLAAWLLLAAVPLVGVAYERGLRLLPVGISLAAVGLLGATRSKGAMVALAVASGVWWMFYQRGWLRWLPLAIGLVVVLAVVGMPSVRAGLEASARVRIGYWSGAVELIREAPLSGLGVGSFAQRSSGVMPLWAEPSRMVHNELLETAVIAGIPLALVLGLLLWLAARPRQSDCRRPGGKPAGEPAVEPAGEPAAITAAAWSLGGIVTYLGLMGLLDGNVGWWPGGEFLLTQIFWTAVVALVMGLTLRVLRDLPLPTVWWLRLGLAACAIHCLVDFNLHSFAIVGTLLVVTILAAPTYRECSAPKWLGGVLFLVVGVLAIGSANWARSAITLRAADDLLRSLRLAGDPQHADDGFHDLAGQLGVEVPAAGDRVGRQALALAAIAQANDLVAGDPTRTVQVVSLAPPSAERLKRLDDLAVQLPFYTPLANLRAQDYAHQQRWDDAVAELRRGITLAPAYLPAHQDLIRLLSRAADHDAARAARWREQKQQAEQQLKELQPIVNYRNRAR